MADVLPGVDKLDTSRGRWVQHDDGVHPLAEFSHAMQESYNKLFAKLFQRPDGRPLRRAAPAEILPALKRLVKATSQQLQRAEVFYDLPTHADPTFMASPHLEKDGRSTATSLFHTARHVMHIFERRGSGTVAVMPRSLFKRVWVPPTAEAEGHYEWVLAAPDAQLLTSDFARSAADMALERNGRRLYRLWRRAGIAVGGSTRSTIRLNPEAWTRYRFDCVLLLWGAAADAFWRSPSRADPNCPCNCEPFALWGGCEHEQCLRAILQEGLCLHVPGQNVGGRGKTNLVVYNQRGVSAAAHHRLANAVAQSASAAGASRCLATSTGPASVASSQASWVYEVADLNLKNEASATAFVGPRASPTASPHARTQDDLQDALRRAGASSWHSVLCAAGVEHRVLTSGHVTIETLRSISNPPMSVVMAADIVRAAQEPGWVSPTAAPEAQHRKPKTRARGQAQPKGLSPAPDAQQRSAHRKAGSDAARPVAPRALRVTTELPPAAWRATSS